MEGKKRMNIQSTPNVTSKKELSMQEMFQSLQNLLVNSIREFNSKVENLGIIMERRMDAKLEEAQRKIDMKLEQKLNEIQNQSQQNFLELFGKLKKDFSTQIVDLRSLVIADNQKLAKEVSATTQEVSKQVNDVENKIKKIETEMQGGEENWRKFQDQLLLLQVARTEKAVRIRGFPEGKNEKMEELTDSILKYLCKVTQIEEENMRGEIDKVFRVNSTWSRNNTKSRDVVVYLMKKTTKDIIMQSHFQQKFQVNGQNITCLKELPFEILEKRKSYYSLTDELKSKKISFRWILPQGVAFTFEGRRYRLDTTDKVRVFLHSLPQTVGEKKNQQKQIQREKEQQRGMLSEMDLQTSAGKSSRKTERSTDWNIQSQRRDKTSPRGKE